MKRLAESRAAVRDSDIVGWLNDPDFRVGLVERGLAAHRIEALATVVEQFREALWTCYVLSGADTDGDSKFHCDDVTALRITVDSVRTLRADYDEAIE
jgi:hypothetical protein